MKRKTVLLVIVGALIAPVASNSRGVADEPARELQGTWSVVAVTMNGLKATEQIAKRLKIIVQGAKITVKPGLSVDGNGKVELGNPDGDEATFTVDSATSPAQINLTFGSGKNKRIVKGIYSVEKGELKICYSPKARPADFANAADSGQTLLVSQRDKP